MSNWVTGCHTVIEARNRKRGAYIPSSLYSLCTGIQRFVRNESVKIGGPTLDIYKDPGFVLFRNVLDSTLKELHSCGVGNTKKQAKVISEDIEERLWHENVLGSDTPEKLLDTLVYLLGLSFALRSGREHR